LGDLRKIWQSSSARAQDLAEMSVPRWTLGDVNRPEFPQKLPVITTAGLRKTGRSRERVRTLVRHGALARIGRGVYVRAATAQAFTAVPGGEHVLRAAAAVVRAGRGAVVSHRSAAIVHGIDLIGSLGGPASLTVGAGSGRRGNTGIRLYTTPLPAEHITETLGLPVTTVARTVIDLARTLAFAEGVAAADSAIRKQITSKRELSAVLAASPQRNGIRRARRVVEFADGRAESALESIARVAFDDCGLPEPALQVWIPGPKGDAIGRVDFCWEQYKTIAEVDGAMKYEVPARAKAQLRRDKRLREAGYQIVHFDWHEITTNPEQVAASIRDAFASGERTIRDPAA
jgi:Protein of unknown function (DUF559)/Transcriptional regulator, AbiEi antitoxin